MEASYVCCAIVVLLLLLPQLPSLIMATSDLVVWALLNPLCIMPCHLIWKTIEWVNISVTALWIRKRVHVSVGITHPSSHSLQMTEVGFWPQLDFLTTVTLLSIYLFCVDYLIQFSSVQLLSHVRLFATPWIAAHQASLSITNSRSSLRLTSIESVMPSSHLILWRPLLLLPPIPPSIRVFSNESTLRMRWLKYWSGLPFPSPGNFPTQGSNLGLPHCRQMLNHLSHWGDWYFSQQCWFQLVLPPAQRFSWCTLHIKTHIKSGFFTTIK